MVLIVIDLFNCNQAVDWQGSLRTLRPGGRRIPTGPVHLAGGSFVADRISLVSIGRFQKYFMLRNSASGP